MGPGRGQLPITMRSNPSVQTAPNKGPSACCTEPLTLHNLRSESGLGSRAVSRRHLGPPWWLRPCPWPYGVGPRPGQGQTSDRRADRAVEGKAASLGTCSPCRGNLSKLLNLSKSQVLIWKPPLRGRMA